MTGKRKITTIVAIVILVAAVIFVVTKIPCFSHNGSSNGANSVNRVSELAKGANVLTDKVLSISGNSVANSEKEVREWADSVLDN